MHGQQGRSAVSGTLVVRHDASALKKGEHGVLERSLIGHAEGQTNFDVRYITIPPDGVATAHHHEWEQATYVLEGSCTVTADDREWTLATGDFVFFEGGVHHGIVNHSDSNDVVLLAVRGPRPGVASKPAGVEDLSEASNLEK